MNTYEGPPKPSVSTTSMKRYADCPRSWLLHYENNFLNDDLRKLAVIEHNLTQDQAVAGSVVHTIITRALWHFCDTGAWPDSLPDAGNQLLDEYIAETQRRAPDIQKNGYDYKHKPACLIEGIYRGGKTIAHETTVRTTIKACLSRFLSDDIAGRFVDLGVETWRLPSRDPDSLSPWWRSDGGVPVWAAFDFALIKKGCDGYLYAQIVDFKTGKEYKDETAKQLRVYAAYGHDQWKIPIEYIHVAPVWLADDREWDKSKADPTLVARDRKAWVDCWLMLKDRRSQAFAARNAGGDPLSVFPATGVAKGKCERCVFQSCVERTCGAT